MVLPSSFFLKALLQISEGKCHVLSPPEKVNSAPALISQRVTSLRKESLKLLQMTVSLEGLMEAWRAAPGR